MQGIERGGEVVDRETDLLGSSLESTSTDVPAVSVGGQLQELYQVETLVERAVVVVQFSLPG